MTARILVVDDVKANVTLLETRLLAEYFEVLKAYSGAEALETCENGKVDVVLLDVMMPEMDGFETCRRLKSDPATAHIPVVMVTALDQISDRVRGLEAGADDFLTKPVNEVALISRVRSLARLKTLVDELRIRSAAGQEMGVSDPVPTIMHQPGNDGRILLVDDRPSSYDRVVANLGAEHSIDLEVDPHQGVFRAAEGDYELVIVSMGLRDFDSLRLCSQIRSLERTRQVPILVIADPAEEARLVRALDLGVNDYVTRPIDRNELVARVRTQIRRYRYTMQLRETFHQSVEMAVTDPLTGLYNRRYMESHLAQLSRHAAAKSGSLSMLLVDIDYFKAINDTYGHDAGDEVLREFATRLRTNARGVDLVCRFGGEEFVVIMPDTELSMAYVVAERMRAEVAAKPFPIRGGSRAINATISIGVATLDGSTDTPAAMMKRADDALYSAKRDGRNRVVANAA